MNFHAIVLQGATTRRKRGEGRMRVSQFSQLESELVGFASLDIGYLWGQFPVLFIDGCSAAVILVCSREEASPRPFHSTVLSQPPEKQLVLEDTPLESKV